MKEYAWMILQNNRPLFYTVRKSRPEAWRAWEIQERPANGFSMNVKAERVLLSYRKQ